MKRYFFSCWMIFATLSLFAQEISEYRLQQHINYLASNKLKGRAPGTKGEILAYQYIMQQMQLYGLKPKGIQGYLQPFNYKRGTNPHNHATHGNTIKAHNVIGYLNNNAEYTIVIGAHYDHLGKHHAAALGGKKSKRKIHNGADDNASGVAVMLELANYFANNNFKEASNFLFIAFSAEEDGLIGSKYFTENPTIDLAAVSVMLNMDMVGRLNDSSRNLLIYGIGTSPDYGNILADIQHNFNLIFDSSGIGPSDHTSFYLKNIPVLHFFTGQHTDYHKPTDDAHKINYRGTKEITLFIKNILEKIAAHPKLQFTETPVAEQEKASFKVSLGIMPDYAFQQKGVKVDAVTNGKPAHTAGIKAGDVILAINNEPTPDVYAYMKQLSYFSKGDEAIITIQRKNEKLNLKVKF